MPPSSPNEPLKTAALLGASGATGQHLLPLLLADPGYGRVVTLGRRKTGRQHDKLDDRVINFDDLAAGLRGVHVDDAYCTFGTTIRIAGSEAAMTRIDHEFVLDFARAAQAAGATRFAYLSAANANATSSVYYARLKGGTEAALMALGFADLSIYRPSMIRAERTDRRFGESLLLPLLPLIDRLLVGRFTRYRSIPVDTLARAIAAFSRERRHGTQTLYWAEMRALAGN